MTSTVSTKPASSAGAIFNDQSFSFETLRALGYTPYGGADIGEVTSTAARIPDGDETAWYSEWRALAERVHADADRSAAEGHPVSARESYLRASNYYRLCEFYLRVDSSNDPEVREVGQLSVDSFARAAQLMNPSPKQVKIPYEGTTLPGWWVPADLGTAHPTGGDRDGPRPTLLFHGGFDSTEEELYFSGGAAAARRGYHVLAFAGPGQGSALRDQKLLFRPDWDAVVTPAVDWLFGAPGRGPRSHCAHGDELRRTSGAPGGRHRAPPGRPHRVRRYLLVRRQLCTAWSAPRSCNFSLPAHDTRLNALVEQVMGSDTQLRGFVRWGMWTYGASSPAAVLRAIGPYTLEGYAPLITCPTLVLDGEIDLSSWAAVPALRGSPLPEDVPPLPRGRRGR